jgi:2-methylcitrate dehydratase PrpD
MSISRRVQCELDADAERVSTEQSVGAKVTFRLRSGQSVERFIESPKGSASRPFTMDDHVARFRQEMLKRFPEARVDALLAEVQGFAQVRNVDRLMQLLAGAS